MPYSVALIASILARFLTGVAEPDPALGLPDSVRIVRAVARGVLRASDAFVPDEPLVSLSATDAQAVDGGA